MGFHYSLRAGVKLNVLKVVKKDLAYHHLREQIINCVLKPGESIFEDKIAESLHISKTPVRQAIHQLEQDGLLFRTLFREIRLWENRYFYPEGV